MLQYQIPSLLPYGAYPMRVQNLRVRPGLGSGYSQDSPLAQHYRPLGLEVPSLGKKSPRLGDFAWDRFPTSILFLAGGAAGFYVGPLIPSPIDTVVKAISIASVGWGIYYLFKGPPTQKEDNKNPKTTLSPAAFKLISGSIVSPHDGTKPDMNWLGEAFDVNVKWYNGSNEDGNITYDVLVDSVATAGVPNKGENWVTKNIPPVSIAVPAGKNVGPLEITIPVVRPPKPGLVGRGLPPSVVYMYLQLRKFDDTGHPILSGESVRVGPFAFS